MDHHVPVTNPVAALRAIRRATWGETPMAHMATHRAVLAPALHDLLVRWAELCTEHDAYTARPTADRWGVLWDAFTRFDEACAALFGPSGAETRDRPQALHDTPARRRET